MEHHKKQLLEAKRQAESIAVITRELEKEFLEVCFCNDLELMLSDFDVLL